MSDLKLFKPKGSTFFKLLQPEEIMFQDIKTGIEKEINDTKEWVAKFHAWETQSHALAAVQSTLEKLLTVPADKIKEEAEKLLAATTRGLFEHAMANPTALTPTETTTTTLPDGSTVTSGTVHFGS